LTLFKLFWENKKLAQQAKRFILFHELAHVALGHLQTKAANLEESRRLEKEADLLAAATSGAADGGAYVFGLFAKYNTTNSKAHPPNAERARYLSEFHLMSTS
jgi:Zn-dependent protease with chaperone function